MQTNSTKSKIVLRGIDGGNPLGFLAALGTAILAESLNPDTRLAWLVAEGGWRPVLMGCSSDEEEFVERLLDGLKKTSNEPFEIDSRLPFSVETFFAVLRNAQERSSPDDRRTVDFLAAFGSEVYPKDGEFQSTQFRMARSGDAAGNGLPVYVLNNRSSVTSSNLRRTLFVSWDYRDESRSHNFRWDPIDDQRYALRWRDPSKSNLKDGPGTMIGANALAIEALRCYPTMFRYNRLVTTGFHCNPKRETWFSWPIWNVPLSIQVIRSVLSLADIYLDEIPRDRLIKRGIVEVYRSQRIQQSKYYSNFTISRPA